VWRNRTRLPLWMPAALTAGLQAPPRGERSEEAVLVTFRVPAGLDPTGLPELPVLEDTVGQTLREHRTGELEGVQRGPGTLTVLAYGADAERLWTSMEHAVRAFPCRPAEVTLRYGLVGAPDRTLPL
jgi:hypothetical protein